MPPLSDEELVKVKELFEHHDVDGKGMIDVIEFADLCEALGATLNEEEIEAGFIAIDVDKAGMIDLFEFATWWQDR